MERFAKLTGVLSKPLFWIIAAFVIWIYIFHGFLFGRFELVDDAVAYYGNTKYFVDQLSMGSFPLWNPYWQEGYSNDFFLRRMGAYNPLYAFMLLLKGMGVKFHLAYMLCLSLYFFSAAYCFYLLILRLLDKRVVAYLGFLLFLFSALGTRLFDSYMMLVTVPLVWFIFFVVAFSQTLRKSYFLGALLACLILINTYIPLYFLIIVSLMAFLFAVIYAPKLKALLAGYLGFIVKNKLLVLGAFALLAFSIIPLAYFLKQVSDGGVSLPGRNFGEGSSNVLAVAKATLKWGIAEDLLYSSYFSNPQRYRFAVVYIPYFFAVLLCLGVWFRMSRLFVFLFLFLFILCYAMMPYGFALHQFLYDHFSFMKYFRNLHFFLWFILIPVFIALVAEHFNSFLTAVANQGRKLWLFLAVVIAHALALSLVLLRSDGAVSTYLMLVLSFSYFILLLRGVDANKPMMYGLLLLLIVIQPIEVYQSLQSRALVKKRASFYDTFKYRFKFIDNSYALSEGAPKGGGADNKASLYYTSRAFNDFYSNISNVTIAHYLRNNLFLVDALAPIDSGDYWGFLERKLAAPGNIAYLDTVQGIFTGQAPGESKRASPYIIDEQTPGFSICTFNANTLKFTLTLEEPRFLVYNDSFDKLWSAAVNGVKKDLYKVNGAFKGLWLPAGHLSVAFTYGHAWQHFLNWGLWVAHILLFAAILIVYRQERKQQESNKAYG